MPVGLSLLLVLFFLLMNAFFVMAEFSLVRVRKSQVDMLVEEGRPGSKYAQLIANNVNAYLSACQLGITLASLALGWLGEPAVSALFHPLFTLLGVPDSVNFAVSVAIGFCLVTALHIVVGELIPKSLAIFSTEKYALFTAAPLVFDESTENGLIDSEQNEFVDNIFDIADKDVEAIMTPRPDMVCLGLEDSLEENLRVVEEHKFTRFPVYRKDKDDIVGFVHIKDLYRLDEHATMADIRILRIVAAPESMPVVKLLQLLKKEKTKIAIVVDEHGGTSGVVTMGDIFEEIIGDYDDEYVHSNNETLTKVSDGHYLTTGACSIDDFAETVGFDPDDFPEYETLGGLLLESFDRIPDVGDETTYFEGDTTVRFVVRSMEVRRIGQVEFWVSVEEPGDEKE